MNVYRKSSILILTLLLFMGVACNRYEDPYESLDGELESPSDTTSNGDEEPYLLLGEDFVVLPTDTTIVIEVESNVDWVLTSTASWCVPQITSGRGDESVEVSISANNTQKERSAILTLSCLDAALAQQIEIRQQRIIPDSTTRYRLPVVFHVLYKSASDKRQYVMEGHLATLIEDVNKLYEDCGVDLGVEFVMATHDPEGNLLEEPGVDRVQVFSATINSSVFMGYGTNPKQYCRYMWDPNNYINIFTYKFESSSVLGISHFPYVIKPHALEGLTELEYDADWSELPWPQCVSINNDYIYSHEDYYTMTDVVNTLAHELGHFLGLRHAFSEDPVTYDRDVCYDSDFCTDTPTYNKSAYDIFMQGCMSSGGRIDDEEKEMLLMREDCETGEEYRSTNIMDYAYTEANRFTPQQAARIRYVLEHSPYIPGPKIRLPEQQVPTTKSGRTNQYVLKTFE